ncbi:hypothetical protein CFIO01_10572 [Colletotrichum fioriniae PJ7]|uniref:Uncharacterized protein n=1 Tax=Colletotrichum fioriniae PJ7 TaxID=1445577 RepID=A0A010RLY4_9PEZI|nr:hypothetical protein CFIO01_10572 [Colletotrichum fioriniae PJ7]
MYIKPRNPLFGRVPLREAGKKETTHLPKPQISYRTQSSLVSAVPVCLFDGGDTNSVSKPRSCITLLTYTAFDTYSATVTSSRSLRRPIVLLLGGLAACLKQFQWPFPNSPAPLRPYQHVLPEIHRFWLLMLVTWWASRRVHGNNSFHDPVSIGHFKNSPANVHPASKTCRSDETKRADRAGLSRIPNGVTVLRPLDQISGESQGSRVNARMKLPRPLHEQTETQFFQLPLHFLLSRADRTRHAARTNA